jgi:hypothetical protein
MLRNRRASDDYRICFNRDPRISGLETSRVALCGAFFISRISSKGQFSELASRAGFMSKGINCAH